VGERPGSGRHPAGKGDLADQRGVRGAEPAVPVEQIRCLVRLAAPRRAGAPASIRAGVEASLRRLRVDRIDLYQMHWPAQDGTPLEEYWQVFTDLKREGKIRAAGLFNHGVLQLEAAEEIGVVDAIQPPFNLIHRDAADDVLLWAREHEAGVIVYSPWPLACSPARSPRRGRPRSSRVTGGQDTPTSPSPRCPPTSH